MQHEYLLIRLKLSRNKQKIMKKITTHFVAVDFFILGIINCKHNEDKGGIITPLKTSNSIFHER